MTLKSIEKGVHRLLIDKCAERLDHSVVTFIVPRGVLGALPYRPPWF
jgi:hypothetical protein